MESLLRWSIENSATDGSGPRSPQAPQSRQDLDPGIIDAILGKPDAVLMKVCISDVDTFDIDINRLDRKHWLSD